LVNKVPQVNKILFERGITGCGQCVLITLLTQTKLSRTEFAGLHIDPKVIGARNSKIQGAHIKRKNNCIVNTGGKLSREELKLRVLKNKEM
jgi:hypothetical protein